MKYLLCVFVGVGALCGCSSPEPTKPTPEEVKAFRGKPLTPEQVAKLRGNMGGGGGGVEKGPSPSGPRMGN